MARGGNDSPDSPLALEAMALVRPLCAPAQPLRDRYGHELHLLGVAALDEINSGLRGYEAEARVKERDDRDAIWQELRAHFPAAQRIAGDMLIMFWDDPAEVGRLAKWTADKPMFRMMVAVGFQGRVPQAPNELMKSSSLGEMITAIEYEIKHEQQRFGWAGSPELTAALGSNDHSSVQTLKVREGDALYQHALAWELAEAEREIAGLDEDLEAVPEMREMMLEDQREERESFERDAQDKRRDREGLARVVADQDAATLKLARQIALHKDALGERRAQRQR